jgi:hypothetical protein
LWSRRLPDDRFRKISSLPPEQAETELLSRDPSHQEAEQFSEGRDADTLAKEARQKEHDREQKFKDSFETLAIAGVWLAALAGVAVGGTWLYHLLTPIAWHWLGPEELTRLQNIFTGGVLVSAAGDHWRKRMR